MDNTIYIILGVLLIVYFLTKGMNRKRSKDRKSKRFMEDYEKRTPRKPDPDRETETNT